VRTHNVNKQFTHTPHITLKTQSTKNLKNPTYPCMILERANMKKQTISRSALLLISATTPLILLNLIAQATLWTPFTPSEKQVQQAFWLKNETANINTTLAFSTGGFETRSWGIITKENHKIWADAETWKWTGPVVQAAWKTTHTYDLGYLKPGKYTFTFKAWGENITTIEFIITGWQIHGKALKY